MKYALFTLPLAVSANIIGSRQLGGLFKAAPVVGIDKLKPEIRKAEGVQRTLTKFGPIDLKASSVQKPAGGAEGHSHGGGGSSGMGMGGGDNTLGGQTFMLRLKDGFCNKDGPCTVYGGRVGVMFADSGKVARPEDGVYIHHVLTADTGKKPNSFLTGCNSERAATSVSGMGMGAGFIGTGEDSGKGPVLYTRADGSSTSGYWLGKGDAFMANVVLVNYNPKPVKVYLTYDLEWSPGEHGSDAKGMLITIEQCGKRIKTSSSGPTNTTGGAFTFREDGTIIGARGHLHDGGVQMDMFINEKFVCSSKAAYGGAGSESADGVKTISGMSRCEKDIAVKKGDKFSMNVQYDLKRYPLRKAASGAEATGVMGMWSITFEPKKSK